MVKFLNMKKKLNFLEPIDDPCRAVIKKFKEKRTKILKQSLSKLKKIPDAEQCLRQAVLIRNTFIRAKDLSPKQFERQLLTQPLETLGQNHSDLLDEMEEQYNTENKIDNSQNSYSKCELQDLNQNYCNTTDCNSNDLTSDSRQLVVVS